MRKLAIRIGTKQFGTYQDYLTVITRIRWPDGFHFLQCGHDHTTVMQRCCQSDYDALPSDCTLFENTRLPLTKWLAAIYLKPADQVFFRWSHLEFSTATVDPNRNSHYNFRKWC